MTLNKVVDFISHNPVFQGVFAAVAVFSPLTYKGDVILGSFLLKVVFIVLMLMYFEEKKKQKS